MTDTQQHTLAAVIGTYGPVMAANNPCGHGRYILAVDGVYAYVLEEVESGVFEHRQGLDLRADEYAINFWPASPNECTLALYHWCRVALA